MRKGRAGFTKSTMPILVGDRWRLLPDTRFPPFELELGLELSMDHGLAHGMPRPLGRILGDLANSSTLRQSLYSSRLHAAQGEGRARHMC